MNAWSYLAGTPFGAVALVLSFGWAVARVVRAVRERRPAVLWCPECRQHRVLEDHRT